MNEKYKERIILNTQTIVPLNFIESSIWRNCNDSGLSWENGVGNLYRSTCQVPDLIDMTILWYIVVKILTKNGGITRVKLTCNEVVRECLFKEDFDYQRIIESLRRWQNFSIEHGGKWQDGVISRSFFSVIDWGRVAEDGLIEVQVNEHYMTSILANRNFLALFSFRFFTFLQDPVACRFYEILCWSFGINVAYQFSIENLGKLISILPENGESPYDYRGRVYDQVIDALLVINAQYEQFEMQNIPGDKYKIQFGTDYSTGTPETITFFLSRL